MVTLLEQTLIVMPAFNEAETVSRVVSEVFDKLPGAHVLVVDDGSLDRTTQVARSAGALVLTLPFNLGVGGAMRVGFKYALQHRFAYVVQIDSDGQHDPSYVPAMIEMLSDSDLVIGARFAGAGSYHVRGPRQWAMRALSVVLSRATNTPLSDTTSGYRASGARSIAIFARHYPAEYLGDTIESLVIASRAGLVVRQLPVIMRTRQGAFRRKIFSGRPPILLEQRSRWCLPLVDHLQGMESPQSEHDCVHLRDRCGDHRSHRRGRTFAATPIT